MPRYALTAVPRYALAPVPGYLIERAPGAVITRVLRCPLPFRCRAHGPYRADRPTGHPCPVVVLIVPATAYGVAMNGVTDRRTVAPLPVRALRIPRSVTAGFVTGIRHGTPYGSVTRIGGIAATVTAISLVPLVTATVPSVAALFAVPAVPAVPVFRRPLLVFGGLLRRSEPSPIATAAARRAVIGRRGGRSVHGLPRLERLTIAFALPQFGMRPEFPRPVGILNRSELSRQHPPKRTHLSSPGTVSGTVSAACHPAVAHRANSRKPGRYAACCH